MEIYFCWVDAWHVITFPLAMSFILQFLRKQYFYLRCLKFPYLKTTLLNLEDNNYAKTTGKILKYLHINCQHPSPGPDDAMIFLFFSFFCNWRSFFGEIFLKTAAKICCYIVDIGVFKFVHAKSRTIIFLKKARHIFCFQNIASSCNAVHIQKIIAKTKDKKYKLPARNKIKRILIK